MGKKEQLLTSRENDLVKYCTKLKKSRSFRYSEKKFLLEGVRLCYDSFCNGYPIQTLFYTEEALCKSSAQIAADAIWERNSCFLRKSACSGKIKRYPTFTRRFYFMSHERDSPPLNSGPFWKAISIGLPSGSWKYGNSFSYQRSPGVRWASTHF